SSDRPIVSQDCACGRNSIAATIPAASLSPMRNSRPSVSSDIVSTATGTIRFTPIRERQISQLLPDRPLVLPYLELDSKSPHPAEPSLVVRGLAAHELRYLGMRQDQEAFFRNPLHDIVGHLLRRERGVHQKRPPFGFRAEEHVGL